MPSSLADKNILLIISGGIAAYKALELIRLLRRAGSSVRCILTKGGAQFVTPLSVAALSEQPVYTDLFSLKDETEMGHIRLSREADLIVVAPASANLISRMAYGLADDLAATVLLASDKPVMIAPAMNQMMWAHSATQENIATLKRRGVMTVGPAAGDMACGETGTGRLSEPADILSAIESYFENSQKLKGLKALVTSGPTYEPLDPVRFIGNRSSGKQGHAIAAALQSFGADVTLITGPVSIPDPAGVKTIHVETAQDMLQAAQNTLPADIAVCAAAVSDWASADIAEHKIKKGDKAPSLALKQNPDILATLSAAGKHRPRLVIGFAAETKDLLKEARAKLARKGCNWIVANNVGEDAIFGSDETHVHLIAGTEKEWRGSKFDIARNLAQEITEYFLNTKESKSHARRR